MITMALESSVDASVGADAVTFTFTVENTGDDPVEVTFRSGLDADFAVVADAGEVWRASDGMMFTQALRPATFAPGQTETYEAEWSDPNPGDYEVVAELAVRKADVEARTTFSVP
jgi:hypothetical protein